VTASDPPPRTLGIDYGRVRVGLAVTDALGIAAHPVGVVENRGDEALLGEVEAVARDREVGHVLLGLPLNMDGSKGPMAKEVEAFARRLGDRLGVEVELWDERLTSHEVETRLAERGVGWKKRKGRVDVGAAALILTEWLRTRERRRGKSH
jgi:putative Holliday junction resolvase